MGPEQRILQYKDPPARLRPSTAALPEATALEYMGIITDLGAVVNKGIVQRV